MDTYIPTIGLEVHAELKTRTKMFCNSKNDSSETRANVNICPICMAHPGTLPVINAAAVKHVLRVGIALGSKLADYTEFDRKNYFYPDLPKGYQLSQFEYPLVSGGSLGGVAITRIHLEEDTASSIHDEKTGLTQIDYNRAGVPLMELVTEPVIHSAEQAGNFGRELQLLLRYLDASDADMEKGNMRLEANISVSKDSSLGTKVEVKNINSFRAMERAVQYEIKRQSKMLAEGHVITQETRGWDEAKQATYPQRIKEGSADYRYFPDPDLPSLRLTELNLTHDSLQATLPELPWQRRQRYTALGINPQDTELYVKDAYYGNFFEKVASALEGKVEYLKIASNYISNDLVSLTRDSGTRDTDLKPYIGILPERFATIIRMVVEKKVSSRSAKQLLATCLDGVSDPEVVSKEKELFQDETNDQLSRTVTKVLTDNPQVATDFKAGKAAALEFLVGQSMKALRGAADAVSLRNEIRKQIEL